MIHLEVKDFQSIAQVKLDIVGFTALVGPSNIGKSAVVRAIKCALTNRSGTSFVRHGESCARALRGAKTCKCFSYVHIQTDGFDLLWLKGDSISRYVFNGAEFDRPGQGIPDFLVSNGFSPVKVGTDNDCVQVADQFQPIFMLNQSGPAIAEAVSDVSRLERVNKATKLVERDRKEAVSTRKVREKDIIDLTSQLDHFAGLDVASLRVATVDHDLQRVTAAESLLNQLGLLSSKYTVVSDRLQVLEGLDQTEVPARAPVDALVTCLSTLRVLVDRYSTTSARVLHLEPTESIEVPTVEPVATLHSKLQVLGKLSARLNPAMVRYKELAAVDLVEAPDLSEVRDLSEMVQNLTRWIQTLRDLKARSQVAESVGKIEVPDLEPFSVLQVALASKVQVLTSYGSRLAALEAGVRSIETAYNQASKELDQIDTEISELGVCPTCTQPVEGAFHSHA